MSANSKDRGTISIAFVHEALQCIRERGLDSDALLLAAGISPELLNSPQARVSSTHYGNLWHLVARTLDDEFFGMDSHRMKVGSYTLLCHALIKSATLERALLRALRFFRVVLDDFEVKLVRDGKVARIVLADLPRPDERTAAAPGLPVAPRRAFAYGTLLLLLHGLACWLVGRRIPLFAADFRCPEPYFSGEWQELFSAKLNFDQASSGICFAAEYLDLPNIQNERSMKLFLRSAPANFLVKYKNSASLTARIRRHLRETPPAAWPDFAELAGQLHHSPSTLRRRLDDEGNSYRAIRDELRRDLAISLLSDSEKSIMDIAAALGFAEASAFHRAFRKWTGARPGEYRRLPR
jgi:AraC-like DNA-binding protein